MGGDFTPYFSRKKATDIHSGSPKNLSNSLHIKRLYLTHLGASLYPEVCLVVNVFIAEFLP